MKRRLTGQEHPIVMMSVRWTLVLCLLCVSRAQQAQRRFFEFSFGQPAQPPQHVPQQHAFQHPPNFQQAFSLQQAASFHHPSMHQNMHFPGVQHVVSLPQAPQMGAMGNMGSFQIVQSPTISQQFAFQNALEAAKSETKTEETVSETMVSPALADGTKGSEQEQIKTIIVTKKVPVPYTVQVEKKVPVAVKVPVRRPYAVFVPKPYLVEIHKPVPYPVKVPIPQAFTLEKHIPVPYKVPIDKPYPVQVPKPFPVVVEKKVPVTIEKPVPVQVKVPVERPIPVHVPVEKPVPYAIEKPVPVPVKVPVDRPIPVTVEKPIPYPVEKPVPVPVQLQVPVPIYGVAYSQQNSNQISYQHNQVGSASSTDQRKVPFQASPSDPVTNLEYKHKAISFLPGSGYNHTGQNLNSLGTIHVTNLKPSQSARWAGGGSSTDWEPKPTAQQLVQHHSHQHQPVHPTQPTSQHHYHHPGSPQHQQVSTYQQQVSTHQQQASNIQHQPSVNLNSQQYQQASQQQFQPSHPGHQGTVYTVSHGTPNYQYTFTRQYPDVSGAQSQQSAQYSQQLSQSIIKQESRTQQPISKPKVQTKTQHSGSGQAPQQRLTQNQPTSQDKAKAQVTTGAEAHGDILKLNNPVHNGHMSYPPYPHHGFHNPSCCPHMNPYNFQGYPGSHYGWPHPYQQYPQPYNPYLSQEVKSQVANPLDSSYQTTPQAPLSNPQTSLPAPSHTTPVNRVPFSLINHHPSRSDKTPVTSPATTTTHASRSSPRTTVTKQETKDEQGLVQEVSASSHVLHSTTSSVPSTSYTELTRNFGKKSRRRSKPRSSTTEEPTTTDLETSTARTFASRRHSIRRHHTEKQEST